MKSTVYKHSNQIDFVLVWCKAGKLCIKSSKCFLLVKAGGKTVRFLFDKNIQEWYKCVVFYPKSKLSFRVKTVGMLKKHVHVLSPIK